MDKKYKVSKRLFAILLVSALTLAVFCVGASAEIGMSSAGGRNHGAAEGGSRSDMMNDMPGADGNMTGNLGDTDGDGVIEDDGGGNSLLPESGAVSDIIDDVTGALDGSGSGSGSGDTARDTARDTSADSGATGNSDRDSSRVAGAIIAIVVAVALIIAVIVLIPKMRNRD